jgi:putative nucleotidyltransferase with HDIG domain
MRCERGAEIARGIGLDEDAATAIGQLFEHWDGNGHPGDLAGDEISLLARMACMAQTMEFFWQEGGAAAACDIARARRGTWFDPELVDAVADLERDMTFWASLKHPDVQAVEPADRVQRADAARLDRIAEAFASIVDAKSPFTARHSAGVANIAAATAATMGLDERTQQLVRRAGLLHDVGKLGISNQILDKPGRLTDGEWRAVRHHPRLSLIILRRVPALADVAHLAAMHHERLDGSGYPYGLVEDDVSLPARILQVADVADALSAERPYRVALPVDEVLAIIRRDAGPRLDAAAFAALEASLPRLAAAA